MSAFQQALANTDLSSGSSLSIRGAATGAPSTRSLSNALRSAGISRDSPGMEIDGGGGGRPARTVGNGRGRGRGGARAAGPLDQSGRTSRTHNDAPYSRPVRPTLERDTRSNAAGPSRSTESRPLSLASRLGRGGASRKNADPRRNPEGTPPILRAHNAGMDEKAKREQASILSAKLRNENMKEWLRARHIESGVMDMSHLPEDAFLKKEDIVAPGHRNASPVVGTVFWRLIDLDVQKALGTNVHTLSLANNDLPDLGSLDKLAYSLPHLRALDLSHNPVKNINELDILLARGEKKGNAMAGAGSLKSLIELKLIGCAFRDRMIEEKGGEAYKHEILRRFPGLLFLDGEQLNRIVFPIERKAKVPLTDDVKQQYHSQPLTFPFDVQPGRAENPAHHQVVMSFCEKFFALFDTNRAELLPAYAPNATLSVGANTLRSRSNLAETKVETTRSERPPLAPFSGWTDLPGRNLFRLSTMDQRLHTLKSPVDVDDLREWWNRVPATKHPLTDETKWCFDTWVVHGADADTRLCAMIQGEFQEMPSGCYRSFSRTFILADAPVGTPAQAAGWPCQVLSDTLVVHLYLSTGAFDTNRSIITDGVALVPPQPVAIPAELDNIPTIALPSAVPASTQDGLVAQLRQATGMNVQFATMCMAQNGWDFARARENFEEIKGTIPPEAFQ